MTDTKTPKPKGMAAAKARAAADLKAGKQLHECPYKAQAWRTVWLNETQRLRQLDFFQ